jgi:pimeloyl-ACP methyl ester carboxylesterase
MPNATLEPARHTADQFITVGGVLTRYRAAGLEQPGVPLVLAHGIGRSLEDWSENLCAFSSQRPVYALDLIGFGLSGKPDVRYSIDDLSDFLVVFMDALGLETVALAGNSLGGAVCVRTALRHSTRVSSLILVAPAGFGQRIAPFLALCTVPGLGEWLTRPSPKSDGARMVLESCFADRVFVTQERIERDHRLGLEPGARDAFLRTLRAACNVHGVRAKNLETVRGQLHRLAMPVLVVWGREDRILPSEYVASAERIAGVQTQVFERCGHFPQLECSARFNALVSDFLEHSLERPSNVRGAT